MGRITRFNQLILALVFFGLFFEIARAETVTVVSRGDDNAQYAIDMIKLGLEKSALDYQVQIQSGAFSAPKLREDLLAGAIDIIWTATSKKLENEALPIRIPLYKGLLGHRILIVHRDNQNIFDQVYRFEDVKQFQFGQGRGWTDTTILEHNGLTVVSATKYEGLFYMADGKRFHAYPRGVHEPWGELQRYSELSLSVDENLMFVYKMPYYLFVSPHKSELAASLEAGLRAAIDDGSFDRLFLSNQMVQMVIEKANLSNRRVFHLDNPELPEATPLYDPSLWVDPSLM